MCTSGGAPEVKFDEGPAGETLRLIPLKLRTVQFFTDKLN
jgi:hypothetical protein